jgi:hypothetical protein
LVLYWHDNASINGVAKTVHEGQAHQGRCRLQPPSPAASPVERGRFLNNSSASQAWLHWSSAKSSSFRRAGGLTKACEPGNKRFHPVEAAFRIGHFEVRHLGAGRKSKRPRIGSISWMICLAVVSDASE